MCNFCVRGTCSLVCPAVFPARPAIPRSRDPAMRNPMVSHSGNGAGNVSRARYTRLRNADSPPNLTIGD